MYDVPCLFIHVCKKIYAVFTLFSNGPVDLNMSYKREGLNSPSKYIL